MQCACDMVGFAVMQVKACRKSLEAAERSGRSNIAEALRAKLSKLTGARDVSGAGEVGSGNSSKTSVDSIAPRLKKGKKILAATQLGADEHGHGVVPLRKRKRKATTSNSEMASIVRKAERNKGSNRATSPPDAGTRPSTVPMSMAGAGTGRRPKKSKVRKVSPNDAQQAAVDLLLKAASKARASRRAMGEESEEEAPLPDLPPPRQGLGEDSGAAPRSDVEFEGEEGEVDIGEEPVEESTCGKTSGATDSLQDEGNSNDEGQEEDDDFFDALEESLALPSPESCLTCFGPEKLMPDLLFFQC